MLVISALSKTKMDLPANNTLNDKSLQQGI
jgi:hypothetical protein